MLALAARIGAAAVACAVLMGAAAPFTALPESAPIYAHLQRYAQTGLLGDRAPWTQDMSRLEAAMLVKRALSAYGEAQLAQQPADAETEAALQADITEFAAELSLLGLEQTPVLGTPAPPAAAPLPATAAPAPGCDLPAPAVEPVAAPPPCDSPTPDGVCPPPGAAAPAPKIEFTPYGDVALQLRAGRTAIATGGTLDVSDVSVYWGEIGVDAVHQNMTAHASILLNSNEASIDLHEAYVAWEDAAGDWRIKGGRMVLPPGSRATTFPSYPAAVDLAYTRGDAVGAGIGKPEANLMAYVFNPAVDKLGENNTLSDYALALHLASPDSNPDRGWALNATMTSNLGASDLQLAGPGPLHKRVGGGNAWAELHWNGDEHRAVAEYSWAFNRFDPLDLDANGDGAGDRPAAFDAEYVHTDCAGDEWGVAFQQTSEMADYARTRYTLMTGRKLNDIATLRLELSRGTFGDYSTIQARHDVQLAAEVRVKF
jgi:hypothetical protein